MSRITEKSFWNKLFFLIFCLCSLSFARSSFEEIVLEGIEIIGAKSFDKKDLKKIMGIPVNKTIKRFTIIRGILKLESFYKENGFLDFKILDKRIIKGKKFYILHIYIKEGNRKVIKDVEVTPDTFEYLFSFLKNKSPMFYSQKILSQIERKIYEKYLSEGFIFFNLNRTKEEKKDSIILKYVIKPGKKVVLNNIKVEGLSPKTRKKIFFDELEIKKGEIITSDKLYHTIKNLYATGIFRSISYEIIPIGDSLKADIIFKIREEKIHALRVGIGYSSEGFTQLRTSFVHLNLFNDAQKGEFITNFHFNLKKILHQEITIKYTDPHFVFRRISLGLSPFFYSDIKEDLQKFGVEGILSYKKVFWITKFSIIWQKVKSIEKEKEFFHLNGLGVSYNQDTRDNILNPEKGAFVFLYSNLYGAFFGGTENLVKFGFDLTRFNKIRTYIFAVRFMGGSIVPYGRTREVPYLERFLVGGEGTIRGIARFSVGEYDIRGIKSGTNFFIFNLEFRKKILTNFQFIIFSDIGTAGNTFSSEILKNMAMGFGFGIRYFLGILPLRIDIGTNPEEINYKKIYLYLGIGQAF